MINTISVIIPSYNHAMYINDCLISILNQDFFDLELIIIDDGSTDGSQNTIRSFINLYKSRFKEVIYIEQENKGLIKTINLGLELSRGNYITIIASDDMMVKDRIKKQIDFMEKNNCLISCGNSIIVKDKYITNKSILTEAKIKKILINQFENLIVDYSLSTPTLMYSRKIIEEFGKMNEDFFIEDWPYFTLISYKYKIGFINQNLCYYRLHNSNTINNKKKMFNEEKRIIKFFFKKFKLKNHIKSKAWSFLLRRNLKRHNNYFLKLVDVIISQILYLDIERIFLKFKSIFK